MKRILVLVVAFFTLCCSVLAQNKVGSIKTDLVVIPDSVIITSNDGNYFIIVANGFAFLTQSESLFRKIVDHMTSDTIALDGIDNCVRLEGTSMKPLSKFYRKEFKGSGSIDKKRALELNGRLYRLTGYKLDFNLGKRLVIDPVSSPPATSPQQNVQLPPAPSSTTQPSSTAQPDPNNPPVPKFPG